MPDDLEDVLMHPCRAVTRAVLFIDIDWRAVASACARRGSPAKRTPRNAAYRATYCQ